MLLISEEKLAGVSNSLGEIGGGARQQALVIRALVLREVRTRFGENRLGYIWAVLEPCLFVAVWLTVFAFFRVGSAIHDMNSVLFVAAGVVPFFAFRHVASFVEAGVSSNNALLQFALVKSVDTLLARFILEAATQIAVGVIVFGLLIALGQARPPGNPLGVYAASASLLLLGFGFGAFNCMISTLWPVYSKFTQIVQRLLFWTSGVFFLAEKFPAPAQRILAWNPVLHGIELFRSGWSYTFETSFASYRYLLGCAGGFLLVALLFERVARREFQNL